MTEAGLQPNSDKIVWVQLHSEYDDSYVVQVSRKKIALPQRPLDAYRTGKYPRHDTGCCEVDDWLVSEEPFSNE